VRGRGDQPETHVTLQGLHLHFDAPSGAAGDMALGALFDLGVPEAVVRAALAEIGVPGYELTVQKTIRRGMAGTDVRVVIAGDPGHLHHHVPEDHHHHDHHHHDPDHHHHDHDHDHPHRHYGEIEVLVRARTSGRTRELALDIFGKIAAAEALLHGVPVAEVAFHEVGAVDSIVDVVGTAAALAWLAPRSVSAAPLPLGHGSVRTAHGLLPVPSPATLEICRAAGIPTYDGGVDKELVTPTGAAILAAVVGRWGPAPPLVARAIGYGAGDRDLADRPNLLRAIVGALAETAAADELVQLEANLDDMSPELGTHAADLLFAAGAVDVWWTPITMKKSRPAFVLAALVPVAAKAACEAVILAETTTLGVRATTVTRRALERKSVTVATAYGPVAVKLGLDGDSVVNAAPEYESCRAAALAHRVPLKEVYAAAVAAYRSA
jgi:uncharacterized protein (TIGR00299 family) protein